MDNLTTVGLACTVVACMSATAIAAANTDSQFPTRAVRIIVPTGPEGGADFVARLLAQGLSDNWRQTVVVENRAGAAGLIGLEILAHASPDGHSLAVISPTHMLAVEQSGKLTFKHGRDFTAIAFPATIEQVMIAYASAPAKSVKDLVELARASPGKLDYATSGAGGASHLAMVVFARQAGIEMTHIPYKGFTAALPDLLTGRVPYAMGVIPPVLAHVEAGRLRVLAVTGATRAPTLPQVPTFAEAGYPRYEMSAWLGVFGPARLPTARITQLNADLNRLVQQPNVVAQLASQGVQAAGRMLTAQMPNYTDREVDKWNTKWTDIGTTNNVR